MKEHLIEQHNAGGHRMNPVTVCGLCFPLSGRPSTVPPSDVDEPAGELQDRGPAMPMQWPRSRFVTPFDPPDYVYVASSWRCEMQPAVIATLKVLGIDHYDFRNPPGGAGFGWGQVMPSFDIDEQLVDEADYLAGLEHPIAQAGFAADFEAMSRADAFVLVLPCGRSAHLELGWAVGAGKRTAILLDGPQVTPELMYRMVDYIAPTMHDLLGWLGVKD